MAPSIKLSSTATNELWDIPVLFEDSQLLVLDKPRGLPVSPLGPDRELPNLLSLLHSGIAEGKAWARERELSFLMNAERLEPETSGVLVFAKNRELHQRLGDFFGSEKSHKDFVTLV